MSFRWALPQFFLSTCFGVYSLKLVTPTDGILAVSNTSILNRTGPAATTLGSSNSTSDDLFSSYEPSAMFAADSTNNVPVCDINHYGALDADNCKEAFWKLKSIGPATRARTWADRDYASPHIQIPLRFSSCESWWVLHINAGLLI